MSRPSRPALRRSSRLLTDKVRPTQIMHARRYATSAADSCATSGRSETIAIEQTTCLSGTFSLLCVAPPVLLCMRIDDTDFEEILALLPQESIPADSTQARQAVENFVDLVELLMRPLPLPPAGKTSFRLPSSGIQGPASPSARSIGSASEVQGRDSRSGFERR